MIQTRTYQPGDEHQIVALYNRVYTRHISLERWRWEYLENPLHRQDIYLAFDGPTLIAQSAGAPFVLQARQSRLRASRIQDVLVHPDYRSRWFSLFVRTLRGLTERLSAEEMDFVICFPNDYSLPAITRKLDYRFVEDVNTFSLLAEQVRPAPDAGLKVDISAVPEFSAVDAALMNSYLSQYALYRQRSPDYLNWRFNAASGRRYFMTRIWHGQELIALAVFKSFALHRSIDVLELYCPANASLISILLKAAEKYLAEQAVKVDVFSFWLRTGDWLHDVLVQMGAVATGQKTHVVFRDFSKQSLYREAERNFYLCMADSDIY